MKERGVRWRSRSEESIRVLSVEAGRVIAQKYRLERPLAKGGMGSIWVARHLLLDVAVAVKFMDPSFAVHGELRARFEREAKASAQMKSPHVVQVHDYGVEGDTAYMVMELLEGEDLAARLARVGRLPLQATAVILAQVCKGLRSAHEAGIVHRDLKPGNIFIARHHEDEIVKVLDFGIAKDTGVTASGTATTTGTLIGSPFYMSPEQIRQANKVDHRSDLWSVGVILYECLTGSIPFEGREIGDTLVAICTEPVTPPSRVAPFLPIEVDRFFERALARDPAHRFQTAREMTVVFAALAGVRASGADWSHFRPSDPPAEPVVMGRTSQPSHPRVMTEVAVANSTLVSAPLPFTQPGSASVGRTAPGSAVVGSAAAGDGTFAPAGRSVTAPGRRGGPAAAVAVAAVGTLLLLAVGGLFVVRWVMAGSGSSAGERPAAAMAAPAGEHARAASSASGASGANVPTTVATEAPPVASAATAAARSSSGLPVPAAAAATSSPSGRRTNAAPAPTSAVFGF